MKYFYNLITINFFVNFIGVTFTKVDFNNLYSNVHLARLFFNSITNCATDPEVCMNVTEIAAYHGFVSKQYFVTTDDGFILGMHRIGAKTFHGLPVFLQHGLLCSSADWVLNLPNQSFAFILADAGFDVWLGNVRGNYYSRQHIKYRPDSEEFWAWSFDEMAEFDLPAMVNFVLETTGHKQLFYVGHSQGTLITFSNIAAYPSLHDKIKLFVALAPVAYVQHIKSPIRILAYFTDEIHELFNVFGVYEFLPKTEITKLLALTVCTSETRKFCENLLFLLCGFDRSQLNETRLPVYVAHDPAGTSVRNVVHYAQLVRSGNFQMYDYGNKAVNYRHYNQSTAPLYDTRKVNVPVALFTGGRDWLADPKDVLRLVSTLPNIVYHQHMDTWDHLDFVWGVDAANDIYKNIIGLFRDYSVNW